MLYESSKILFSRTEKKGELIEGTAFTAKQMSAKYFSRENVVPSFGNTINMKLSSKIAYAILNTQKNDTEYFLANNHGESALVVVAKNTSKGNDIHILPFNGNQFQDFLTTNVYSKSLVEGIIAKTIADEPKGELAINFSKIDFSQGIIDSNQMQQFFIAADATYFSCKKLDNKDVVEVDLDTAKGEVLNWVLKTNLTPLLNPNHKEIDWFKETGIKLNYDASYEVQRPTVEKKKTIGERIDEYKSRNFSIYTSEELAAMPEELQAYAAAARRAFNANKEFFDLRTWQLIEDLYDGTVERIGFLGPAGVGKTTTIRAIAGALNMPFVLVGGSSGIEEASLFGYDRLVSDGKSSISKWQDGPLTLAMRYGAFLLFDEVNSADAGVLMKLNTALDDSKCVSLDCGVVPVHQNFKYAEAMNVGYGYYGTGKMNVSHFDRVDQIFKFKDKSIQDEAEMLASITGYDNIENLKKVSEVGKYIRQLIIQDGDTSEMIMSPRRLINWVKSAKKTGEFIDSSMNTVISHLSIYDDSIEYLDSNSIRESEGIASTAFQRIVDTFEDIYY